MAAATFLRNLRRLCFAIPCMRTWLAHGLRRWPPRKTMISCALPPNLGSSFAAKIPMRDSLSFFHEFVRNPTTTGAIAPSSRRLALAMVDALGPMESGQVLVELGPGTGSFTRIFRHTLPENPLVACEFNRVFAELLRRRHPDVAVIEGCASQLGDHLSHLAVEPDKIAGIISGLPLLSLPEHKVQDILLAIGEVLPANRSFVQFTYLPWLWRSLQTPGLKLEHRRWVWRNLPPASLLVFRKRSAWDSALACSRLEDDRLFDGACRHYLPPVAVPGPSPRTGMHHRSPATGGHAKPDSLSRTVDGNFGPFPDRR